MRGVLVGVAHLNWCFWKVGKDKEIVNKQGFYLYRAFTLHPTDIGVLEPLADGDLALDFRDFYYH